MLPEWRHSLHKSHQVAGTNQIDTSRPIFRQARHRADELAGAAVRCRRGAGKTFQADARDLDCGKLARLLDQGSFQPIVAFDLTILGARRPILTWQYVLKEYIA